MLSTENVTWTMWSSKRPCKALQNLEVIFPATNARRISAGMNLQPIRELMASFQLRRNLTSGLRYARIMKDFTYILQPVSHKRNVFKNDFADAEMTGKHQRFSQEMFMSRYWTGFYRGITHKYKQQLYFDHAKFAISDYVMQHLIG